MWKLTGTNKEEIVKGVLENTRRDWVTDEEKWSRDRWQEIVEERLEEKNWDNKGTEKR